MLENLKTKIKENPEKAKKIGLAAGALVGVTVAGTLIYLNRDRIEFPGIGVEELPELEVPTVE